MRDGLLFLHILGAAGWIGGGLHGWYTHTKLARNGSTTGRALETVTAAAGRYFGPVAALTLLSGIALVWTEDAWTWTDTFVLIGLGVFVFSGIFQPLASKTEKRLLAAVEDGSDVGPALRASHRVYAIDLAVVLVALWAMVAKLGAG